MTTILFLFVVGLVMVLLEIFLPGGVLGVLGGVAMIVATVFAFRDYGTGGGLIAVAVGVVLVAGAFTIEFVYLPKTRFGKRFFLNSEVKSASTARLDTSTLIGKTCVAETVLAPTGVVLLDGKKIEAFCRDGYAERGATLKVCDADNFRLIVSKSWT